MLRLLKTTLFENVSHSNEEFTRHFHDTYTIGITYEGVMKTFINSNFYESYEYSVRINNPGEVHGGLSQNWAHANFYPCTQLLTQIYEEIFHDKKIPYFTNHIINDKILFFKIHQFFYAYFNQSESMVIESALIDALSYLVLHHTHHTQKIDALFHDTKLLRNTDELIEASIDTNFTLDTLAQNVSLSKFHFLRVFKKESGMTPHAFIINKRLNKAKSFIQSGMPISEAASMVGFNDQSHFTRNFKRIYGYTPKKLQTSSNILIF
jgi:AraC-like DNA-binding protein